MSDVDPTLLGISDVLVLDALTRAWARTVKRSNRAVLATQRHNQYLRTTISEERIDAVLHDAWVMCPLLAQRHNLQVDAVDWSDKLDGYTRALLMMQMPHSPTRLIPVLAQLPLVDDDGWPEEDQPATGAHA